MLHDLVSYFQGFQIRWSRLNGDHTWHNYLLNVVRIMHGCDVPTLHHMVTNGRIMVLRCQLQSPHAISNNKINFSYRHTTIQLLSPIFNWDPSPSACHPTQGIELSACGEYTNTLMWSKTTGKLNLLNHKITLCSNLMRMACLDQLYYGHT